MANIRARLAEGLEQDNLLSVVRGIFKELQTSSNDGSPQAQSEVFEFLLDILETEDIGKDTGQQLVSILLVEVDHLNPKTASDTANKILQKIKNGSVTKGRSLELFPKLLLSIVESDKEVNSKCLMDTEEERCVLLDTLCTIRWPQNNVCAIITMCRDIKMSDQELKKVFSKAFTTMRTMKPSELPPVIYQLIALSAKGLRSLALNNVVMLFNELDKEVAQTTNTSESDITIAMPQNELLQTEGTVMVHISFAIKQQQELGKELIDAVKTSLSTASVSLMSPFCVAVLLSVSRIHGLQDQIFALLKSAVTKSIRDMERWKCSRWIKDTTPTVLKMEDLLLDTVKNSSQGWDSVLEGLVAFAFYLMEGFSPKFPNAPFADLTSVHQQVCSTGAKLLVHTYEVHRIARKEIVKQILKSIVTSSSTYSKHYIGILAKLIRKSESRETVLDQDCIKTIEGVLNYLPFFPLTPADEFMEAIQPLLKYSVSLKEALLVVLRNAMLSKRIDGRCIAVKGYLLLLRKVEILDEALLSSQNSQPVSGSQVFVELHGTNMSASNEALCLEILGNLRRCLSQQVEVRRILYEGVYAVFCANEKLQVSILEFLMDHLMTLCSTDQSDNLPIDFAKCVTHTTSGVTTIREPVDSLLSSLVLCYMTFRDNNDSSGASPIALKVCDHLKSLVLRIVKVEPSDIDLDKDSDFSITSSSGSKNLCLLSLLTRCCEVLMEFVFGAGDYSVQCSDQVLQLFSTRQSLLKSMTEKSGASGGKRPMGKLPAVAQSYLQSCLSLPSVLSIFKGLYSDSLPSHQPGLAVLRDSTGFCRHVLSVSLQMLSSVLENSRCNGMCSTDYDDEILRMLQGFGRGYLKQLQLACLPGQKKEDSSLRGRSLPSLSVEGLATVLDVCCQLEQESCRVVLAYITSEESPSEANVSSAALLLIRKFQRLINSALSDPPEVDIFAMRDVVSLATAIQRISALVDEEEMADLLRWSYDICREQKRDDTVFCKGFLALLFSLYQRCDSGLKLVKKVCVDIHLSIGDIDEEVEVKGKRTLNAVTLATASPCCLTLLLSHIETIIGDAEWFVSRMKSEDNQSNGLDSIDVICKEQMTVLILSFHELTQTGISPGPLVDTIIKLITRLYNILKDITKQMLAMYSHGASELPATFIRMVDLTGTHLTPSIYSYIHYIQSAQSLMATETTHGKKGKGKNVSVNPGTRKVYKELRCIPQMIFAVEEYEKFLIKMGKKAKVDLMKNFKRSTARDFKINSAAVNAILAEDMDDEPSELVQDGAGEESMTT